MAIVSVVIPTCGRPELVMRAVISALRQTIADIEVIVVIDGPDVGTEQALAALRDDRLKVIPLSTRVGGAEARNVGARASLSPWIALLDDDDEWLPMKCERQLAFAQGKPFELIVSQFYLRDHTGEDHLWPIRFPAQGEPISEYMFCTVRNVFQTSTMLCTRELFLRVPFTKGLKRLQDWDWILRIFATEDACLTCVPEALSIYNVNRVTATISKAVDWRLTYDWATENRSLMTDRAYRGLIAKKCAPDAAQQKTSLRVVWLLFRQCTTGPNISLREPLFFLLYYLLPPERRMSLGNRLRFRSRVSATA